MQIYLFYSNKVFLLIGTFLNDSLYYSFDNSIIHYKFKVAGLIMNLPLSTDIVEITLNDRDPVPINRLFGQIETKN